MSRRVVEKERFLAQDAKGKRYTVVRYAHMLLVETMGAPDEWVETIGEVRTADGQHLNPVEGSPDEFEFLEDFFDGTKLRIKRVRS
jgi:hypothetical protein